MKESDELAERRDMLVKSERFLLFGRWLHLVLNGTLSAAMDPFALFKKSFLRSR